MAAFFSSARSLGLAGVVAALAGGAPIFTTGWALKAAANTRMVLNWGRRSAHRAEAPPTATATLGRARAAMDTRMLRHPGIWSTMEGRGRPGQDSGR